jgi:hypothetical protein
MPIPVETTPATASQTPLITLANFKTYLGPAYTGATEDETLSMLIIMVSKMIDNYIGTPVIQATYTNLILSGRGKRILNLPYWPVTAIGTVTEDGETLINGGDSADFYLVTSESDAYLKKAGGGIWADVPDNVAISTLTAGYALVSVPADIQISAYREVARFWKEDQGRAWGVTSRNVGGGSVSYVEHDALMKSTQAILKRYQRINL